jgi:TruD family tRNA pseudouridine synthase
VAEPEAEATDGTHLWFTVEKRDVSTPAAARRIAKALGRRGGDVSFAGRKDAVAITRQRMSVEHVDVDQLLGLELDGVRVSQPRRHRRKLRPGELRGNRFELVLRGVAPADVPRLEAALDELRSGGVANRYGEQRFGPDGAGLGVARSLVFGPPEAYLEALARAGRPEQLEASLELLRRAVSGTSGERRRADELCPQLPLDLVPVAKQLARRRTEVVADLVAAVPRSSRVFHLAILQAWAFNRVLDRRVEEGSSGRVLTGDLVLREDGRHGYASEDRPAPPGAVPTGPIWAPALRLAEGTPGDLERAVLAEEGLGDGHPDQPGGLSPRGSRRDLRVALSEAHLDASTEERAQGAVRLTFGLPPGAYATVVLDHLRAVCLDPG